MKADPTSALPTQEAYLLRIKALSLLCHDVVARCNEQVPDALHNAAVLLHDNGLLVSTQLSSA